MAKKMLMAKVPFTGDMFTVRETTKRLKYAQKRELSGAVRRRREVRR